MQLSLLISQEVDGDGSLDTALSRTSELQRRNMVCAIVPYVSVVVVLFV